MACNVFGNPITNLTLEGMPEYSRWKTITGVDRARVALNMKNAGEKDVKALTYVEKLKEQWGTGISTLGLIYNATGDPMTYAGEKNWYGHIGPAPYPLRIENGQWGAFLHVKKFEESSGSNAAVFYRGKTPNGNEMMVSWSNPWDRAKNDNKVYAETRDAGHFSSDYTWSLVNDLLNASNHQHSETWQGCISTVITGSHTSPILEAHFTLAAAVTPED